MVTLIDVQIYCDLTSIIPFVEIDLDPPIQKYLKRLELAAGFLESRTQYETLIHSLNIK
jgi:hypothetical protein